MDNTKNNLEQKEKKGLLKKIIILVIILIVIFFIWFLTLPAPAPEESQSQQEWIDSLSQEDLDLIRSFEDNNADIPTRTTPEQTYAALKDALKNEDVEVAVNCFAEEKREEWKKIFLQLKKEGSMEKLTKELSDDFTKNHMLDSTASYSIPQNIDGEVFVHTITFIKDSNGDWKIDIL
ncbi:MAG: hypothetical protein ABIC82_04890 [bacterium]